MTIGVELDLYWLDDKNTEPEWNENILTNVKCHGMSWELSQGLAARLSLDFQKQCCQIAFIIAKVAKWCVITNKSYWVL